MKIDDQLLANVCGGAMCMVKNDYGASVDVAEGYPGSPFQGPRSRLQPGESMFVGAGRFAAGTDRVMTERSCTSGESYSVGREGGWLDSSSPTLSTL